MFIYNLFELDMSSTQKQRDALTKTSEPKRGDIYHSTQDAPTKDLMAQARRIVPGAKSDQEALAGLTARLSQELDSEQATNKDQATQIRKLSRDASDKEKRFQELTKKMADMPGLTDQEKARMAQEIEKEVEKDIEQRLPVDQHISAVTAPSEKPKQKYNPKTGTPTGPISKVAKPASNVVALPTAAKAPVQQPAQAAPTQPVQATPVRPAQADVFAPLRHYATANNPNLQHEPRAQTAQQELPLGQPTDTVTIDPKVAANAAAWLQTAESLQEQHNPAVGNANLASLIKVSLTPDGQPLPLPPTFKFTFGEGQPIIPLSPKDIQKIWDVIGDKNYTANDAMNLKTNVLSDFKATVDWLSKIGVRPNLNLNQMSLDLPATQQPLQFNKDVQEDAWFDGQSQWSSEHDQWTKESAEQPTARERWLAGVEKRLQQQKQDELEHERKTGPDFEKEFAKWQKEIHDVDEGATVSYTVTVQDPASNTTKEVEVSALTLDDARAWAELKGLTVVDVKPTNPVDEDCWKGYKQIGMKDKHGRKVPNCVPVSESKNYWAKLQSERQTKLNSLVNELTETIKK